jgi:hypothetical protein
MRKPPAYILVTEALTILGFLPIYLRFQEAIHFIKVHACSAPVCVYGELIFQRLMILSERSVNIYGDVVCTIENSIAWLLTSPHDAYADEGAPIHLMTGHQLLTHSGYVFSLMGQMRPYCSDC